MVRAMPATDLQTLPTLLAPLLPAACVADVGAAPRRQAVRRRHADAAGDRCVIVMPGSTRHPVALSYSSQFTIHGTPNLSVSMPNCAPQNCFENGIATLPP